MRAVRHSRILGPLKRALGLPAWSSRFDDRARLALGVGGADVRVESRIRPISFARPDERVDVAEQSGVRVEGVSPEACLVVLAAELEAAPVRFREDVAAAASALLLVGAARVTRSGSTAAA